KPATRHDAVQMRMVLQLVAPGVQCRQQADACSKLVGIGSDLQEGLCGGVEQQAIQFVAVAHDQSAQAMRQREDHMEVRYGQQVAALAFQPSQTLVTAALGTVAIAAGVVVITDVAAVGAAGGVAAEGCSTTGCQVT